MPKAMVFIAVTQTAPTGGKVVLTGIAIHSKLVDDASELVGAVSGVKEVQNRMVVVHGPRPLA